MNKNLQYLALLLLTSAATGVLHSRISNITYKSITDVDTDNIPTMDPTASSLDSLSGSKFISYYDQTYGKMILAETVATNKAAKTVLSASSSGGAVKLTSLAPAGELTLQNRKFDRIAGTPGYVALRDGTDLTKLCILNTLTAGLNEAMCQDGDESTGNIDNFIVVGDKIVAGIYQNSESTYDSQAYGRIRVLSLADGAQLGIAKKNVSGSYTELKMHAGADSASLNTLISGNNSEVSNIGAMTWDAGLQRLFISFSRNTESYLAVNRMPFLVGRFSDNDLLIEGLAPTGAGSMAASSVVSFHVDATAFGRYSYSIPHLKTMHVKATKNDNTTIDNAYLIAQINYDLTYTSTEWGNRRVFAVPLVNSSTAADADLGKAAKIVGTVPDFATAATSVSQLYGQNPTATASDVRALVGGDYVPVSSCVDIKGMEVVGQTVLVATTASGSAPESQIGVWASTAIIDENGVITGWSPWTRVAGLYEQVFGLGVDKASGQIWAVHGDTKSGAVTHYAAVSLPSLTGGLQFTASLNADTRGLGAMAQQVESDITGQVYAAKHFHANRVPGLGGNSLMAFGGNGQLAVARIGAAGSVDELHKSTAVSNYTFQNALSTHYKLFDSDELRSIGNIYAVEFSRLRDTGTPKGYLFVGGENGLAIISNNGTAFSPTALSNVGTAFSSFGAKKFSNVSGPVIGLAAVNTQNNGSLADANAYLLVLTKTGLSRISLASTFSDSNVGGGEITVEPVDLGLASDEYCLFLEMLSNHANSNQGSSTACGVLVTTKKLYLLNGLEGEAISTSVTLPFGSKIRRVQILPRAPYRTLSDLGSYLDDSNSIIANLLITTGTAAQPASEVYLVPLIGNQYANITLSTGRQAGYSISDIGSPLKLASADNLGSNTLFASNATGLGLTLQSQQKVDGKSVNAQVKLLGGSQLQDLGSISISAMTASTGGSGGLVLTDRDGNILVQE